MRETVTVRTCAIDRILDAVDRPALALGLDSPSLVQAGADELISDRELLRVAPHRDPQLRGELAAR